MGVVGPRVHRHRRRRVDGHVQAYARILAAADGGEGVAVAGGEVERAAVDRHRAAVARSRVLRAETVPYADRGAAVFSARSRDSAAVDGNLACADILHGGVEHRAAAYSRRMHAARGRHRSAVDRNLAAASGVPAADRGAALGVGDVVRGVCDDRASVDGDDAGIPVGRGAEGRRAAVALQGDLLRVAIPAERERGTFVHLQPRVGVCARQFALAGEGDVRAMAVQVNGRAGGRRERDGVQVEECVRAEHHGPRPAPGKVVRLVRLHERDDGAFHRIDAFNR